MIKYPDNFDLNNLPYLDIIDKCKLPKISGVYIVMEQVSGLVLYVGRAQNLKQRWANHHKLQQFDIWNQRLENSPLIIKWLETDDANKRTDIEYELIKNLKPLFNTIRKKGPIQQCQPEYDTKFIPTVSRYSLGLSLTPLAKHIVLVGYTNNSSRFCLPKIQLNYSCENLFIENTINEDEIKCWRLQKFPNFDFLDEENEEESTETCIWETKCNGVAIELKGPIDEKVLGGPSYNNAAVLAGIPLLKISDEHIPKDREWEQILAYTIDLIAKDE